MTTLTTVLGLVPLILFGGALFPLYGAGICLIAYLLVPFVYDSGTWLSVRLLNSLILESKLRSVLNLLGTLLMSKLRIMVRVSLKTTSQRYGLPFIRQRESPAIQDWVYRPAA